MNRRIERRAIRVAGGVPSSDPMAAIAALTLTMYFDGADYVVGTWTGRASAGTSARNATTAGSDPTVGAALNGIPTVAFASASAQYLAFAYALSTVFTASAWSFWCLCKLTSNGAAQVLFSDQIDGYAIMNVTAVPEWNPIQFSGGYGGPTVAASYGAWQLLQGKYDGTNIKARVNSGSWTSAAVGNVGALVQNCRVGATYNATLQTNGLVASMGAAQTALSDANFDTIKAALNTRYGLAL